MIGVAIVGLGWWGKTLPRILAESRRLWVVRLIEEHDAQRPQ
jgi:hypothetical protein